MSEDSRREKLEEVTDRLLVMSKQTEEWRRSRDTHKVIIERYYAGMGVTPQQLLNKARKYGVGVLSSRDRMLLGVWSYMSDDMEAEEQYNLAVEDGATQVTIPLKIGEQGYVLIDCCNEFGGKDWNPLSTRVELSLFEHNVWTCPRCGTVYALRNMAASAEGEEDER